MKSFYSVARKAALLIVAAVTLLLPTIGQTAEGWLVDFEKAKAKAANQPGKEPGVTALLYF